MTHIYGTRGGGELLNVAFQNNEMGRDVPVSLTNLSNEAHLLPEQ